MTYSDAIARGRGRLEFFLQIDGIKYVLGTCSDAPTDSWYTSGGFSLLSGLRFESIKIGCQARPGEVWPEPKSFDLVFDDHTQTLGPFLKSLEACNTTDLSATVDASDTTINVVSTAAYASSGDAHLNQETFGYTGKTATSFTGCSRGKYGSQDVEHVRDTNMIPPCIPEVSDGPGELRGRRCVLYAAEQRNGTLSATEQIWVGIIDGYCCRHHDEFTIPVSHIVKVFAEGTVFGWVPQGRLRGLYIPNYDGLRWGRMEIYPETSAGGATETIDIVADGTATFFESAQEVVEAWLDEINALDDWRGGYLPDGKLFIEYTGASASPFFSGDARLGEILGFVGGGSSGGILILGGGRYEADEYPCSWFAALDPWVSDFEPRLYLRSGEAAWFREAFVKAEIGGDELGAKPVIGINETYDYLELGRGTAFSGAAWGAVVYGRGDGLPPIISQVWGFHDVPIHEVVRLLWAGETYAESSIDYTVPGRWLTEPCMQDTDVDWDELERLTSGLPWVITSVGIPIDEPTEVAELLTGNLLAAGIYCYPKADGTVGWARARVPAATEAEVTVDGAYIDTKKVPDVDTQEGRERLMNAAQLAFESWEEEKKNIYLVDARSLQRYGAKLARDMKDPLSRLSKRAAEMKLAVSYGVVHAVTEYVSQISRHMGSTVLQLLSRPRATVRLPVTPKARSLSIGDVVLLTSPWVYDMAIGTLGVEDKLAMVIGFEHDMGHARGKVDWLSLMLFDRSPGVISPAARLTSYDGGSKIATFAVTTIYKREGDTSDLDHFSNGDDVECVEEDSESPDKAICTLGAIDVVAGTAELTVGSGTLTAPCIMRFDDYSSCGTDQQNGGWIWIADDADGEVDDAVDGWRWA